MTRKAVAQTAPHGATDLTGFPAATPSAKVTLYRAHSAGRAPWWFSSDGSGRFDVPPPSGTLYLADDVASAVRERLAHLVMPGQRVFEQEANGMVVSRFRPVAKPRCANVSDPSAVKWGVTRELTTMTDYSVTNAWAHRFLADEFQGVRYASRFTTGGSNAWALFGPAGKNKKLTAHSASIEGRAACLRAGIQPIPVPSSAGLTRISPGAP
jgi:RES domain-containing protein